MWLPLVLLLLPTLRPSPPADTANVVTVTARDYAFEMPDSLPAGATTFVLRNRGTVFHIVALARLDGQKTVAEFLAAYEKGGEPAWSHAMGGPGPALPGHDIATTVVLEPGRYAVFCDIAAQDHVAHWKKGMFKLLTVVPSPNPATPPASDVTATLVDYTFRLSEPLTPGGHVIRVTNASASKVHMLAIVRFAPGKTVADEENWDHHGPEPIQWTAGTTDLSPGATAYVRATLEPGSYGLFCFDDDPDGTSHLQHGMQQLFTVK